MTKENTMTDPWTRKEVIGDCTLYLGDCLEVMPALGKVDAVVTDPPYGIGFSSQPTRWQRANGMRRNGWDDVAPHVAVTHIVAAATESIIWGGNYFALPPSRGWLIWSKSGNAPSMADAEMAWTSRDMNTRVFNKSVKSASLEKNLQTAPHPTQKPLALMQWCLGFLPNAETILDPFMGSGTTLVACAKLGRKGIGIELDPDYFEIACKRVQAAYDQPDLFVAPPKPATQEGFEL
jgi:DNA modification methylase